MSNTIVTDEALRGALTVVAEKLKEITGGTGAAIWTEVTAGNFSSISKGDIICNSRFCGLVHMKTSTVIEAGGGTTNAKRLATLRFTLSGGTVSQQTTYAALSSEITALQDGLTSLQDGKEDRRTVWTSSSGSNPVTAANFESVRTGDYYLGTMVTKPSNGSGEIHCAAANTYRKLTLSGGTVESEYGVLANSSDVTALRGDVTALRGDVTALRGDLTSLGEDVDVLRPSRWSHTQVLEPANWGYIKVGDIINGDSLVVYKTSTSISAIICYRDDRFWFQRWTLENGTVTRKDVVRMALYADLSAYAAKTDLPAHYAALTASQARALKPGDTFALSGRSYTVLKKESGSSLDGCATVLCYNADSENDIGSVGWVSVDGSAVSVDAMPLRLQGYHTSVDTATISRVHAGDVVAVGGSGSGAQTGVVVGATATRITVVTDQGTKVATSSGGKVTWTSQS